MGAGEEVVVRGREVSLRLLERPDPRDWRRWMRDAEARRFLGGWPEAGPEDRVFAIERPDGRRIGEVRLTDLEAGVSAELLVLIGDPRDRGRGWGGEAVDLAVDYAFRQLRVGEVLLRVMPENRRAVRCYERCGFVKEGVLRARGSGRERVWLMTRRRAG